MASRRTVILHGWSDCAENFVEVKKLLQGKVGTVDEILYADYESREDSLSYSDLIDALNDRFRDAGIIDADGKKLVELNVVVHSTGGLVIREWINSYYGEGGCGNKVSKRLPACRTIEDCPVKRIVMLAPANFGSPLAHRGKSFLGELFKGRWKIGDFLEVGRQLLEGLELASPYQWHLAHRDLLIEKPYFNAAQIQVTVLVGIDDYTGARGWINKPGTDGTVVIAGTSLDAAKICLDFSKSSPAAVAVGHVDDSDEYTPFEWNELTPPEEFGFGVLPGLNHGTIVQNVGTDKVLRNWILRALTTTDEASFKAIIDELEASTKALYDAERQKPGGKRMYQQFVVHAVDEFGESIRDFTVEFQVRRRKQTKGRIVDKSLPALPVWFGAKDKSPEDKESYYSEKMNGLILDEMHAHTVDPSYRRMLVDLAGANELLSRAANDLKEPLVLTMRLIVPAKDKGISYDVQSLQNIVLIDHEAEMDPGHKAPRFFFANTTTLIEMVVNRLCNYVWLGPVPRPKH